MRRLLPDPAETTIDDQVAELDLVALAPDDRPHVFTNFALTLDGRATLGGRSGEIGSDADTAMLVGLRTCAEAIMIGAGTMRTERYGRPVADPEKRARRESRGLSPDPLMVIVSGSLELPWDADVFTNGGGEVLVLTTSEREPPETATPVGIRRYEGMVDLADALQHLRSERGVRALLCEGGPHLHAQLIEADLVDELFVTHAPKLAGGEGPHLVAGLPERERRLELTWLLHEPGSDELFARYRVPG
jgi:riboflavin-specific deaminase-like protein